MRKPAVGRPMSFASEPVKGCTSTPTQDFGSSGSGSRAWSPYTGLTRLRRCSPLHSSAQHQRLLAGRLAACAALREVADAADRPAVDGGDHRARFDLRSRDRGRAARAHAGDQHARARVEVAALAHGRRSVREPEMPNGGERLLLAALGAAAAAPCSRSRAARRRARCRRCTLESTGSSAIICCTSGTSIGCGASIALPLMLRMRSPARRPAFSGGEPRSTAFTSTPSVKAGALERAQAEAERDALDAALGDQLRARSAPASVPGIAKARSPPTIMPRVLTPTMRPLRSTSGPPELPGAIEASCWIQA